MPTYITLYNWTEKGIKDVKDAQYQDLPPADQQDDKAGS